MRLFVAIPRGLEPSFGFRLDLLGSAAVPAGHVTKTGLSRADFDGKTATPRENCDFFRGRVYPYDNGYSLLSV
jgi:hypothetical protein